MSVCRQLPPSLPSNLVHVVLSLLRPLRLSHLIFKKILTVVILIANRMQIHKGNE